MKNQTVVGPLALHSPGTPPTQPAGRGWVGKNRNPRPAIAALEKKSRKRLMSGIHRSALLVGFLAVWISVLTPPKEVRAQEGIVLKRPIPGRWFRRPSSGGSGTGDPDPTAGPGRTTGRSTPTTRSMPGWTPAQDSSPVPRPSRFHNRSPGRPACAGPLPPPEHPPRGCCPCSARRDHRRDPTGTVRVQAEDLLPSQTRCGPGDVDPTWSHRSSRILAAGQVCGGLPGRSRAGGR